MSAFSTATLSPWYRRWWGKLLIVLGVFVAVPLVLMVVMTARFWWQIKQGRPVQLTSLEGDWSKKISSVGVPTAAVPVDRVKLEGSGEFLGGSLTAPVTIVEYVDFKCPNCLIAWPIIEQLKAKHPQKIKVVIRNFPIESIHPGATELAAVAECAAAQGRYAPMFNLLFNRSSEFAVPLSDTDIHLLAMDAVVDETKLRSCMVSSKTLTAVQDDFTQGVGFGVAGTPTFFVNGSRVEGAVPLEAWEKYLSGLGY